MLTFLPYETNLEPFVAAEEFLPMKATISLLLALALAGAATAQDLVGDRPDFTESALTVEPGPVEARSVEFSEAAVRLQGLITQMRQLTVAPLVERAAQDLAARRVGRGAADAALRRSGRGRPRAALRRGGGRAGDTSRTGCRRNRYAAGQC